jgi:3(or 17)beta-hydroxysteroid dehydrogenase
MMDQQTAESPKRFAGLHAVVTGAASGIGRETALRLAREGAATLTLADVDSESLDHLNRELAGLGASVHVVTGDVGTVDAWNAIAHARRSTGVDVLINNAGIAYVKPVEETSLTEWHRTIDVNLMSVFLSAKYLFPSISRSGSVINVASMVAFIGQEITPAYVASKGGVLALTRALAVDYAKRGIRVNVVCPGYTDTPMIQRHFDKLGNGPEERAKLERRTPLGRLVSPKDVAAAILFLASSDAQMVTGASLVVDGGLSAVFDYRGEVPNVEVAPTAMP